MTTNAFEEIDRMRDYIDAEDLFESRFINNGDGNPIYIAISPYPNADPALPIWYVRKIHYTGTVIDRVQQPDQGRKFGYTVNDIAGYFS